MLNICLPFIQRNSIRLVQCFVFLLFSSSSVSLAQNSCKDVYEFFSVTDGSLNSGQSNEVHRNSGNLGRLEKSIRMFTGPLRKRFENVREVQELSRDFRTMALHPIEKPRNDMERMFLGVYLLDTEVAGVFRFKWSNLEGYLSKARSTNGRLDIYIWGIETLGLNVGDRSQGLSLEFSKFFTAILDAVAKEKEMDSSIQEIQFISFQVYNQDLVTTLKKLGFEKKEISTTNQNIESLPWDKNHPDYVKTWYLQFNPNWL